MPKFPPTFSLTLSLFPHVFPRRVFACKISYVFVSLSPETNVGIWKKKEWRSSCAYVATRPSLFHSLHETGTSDFSRLCLHPTRNRGHLWICSSERANRQVVGAWPWWRPSSCKIRNRLAFSLCIIFERKESDFKWKSLSFLSRLIILCSFSQTQ